MSTPPEPPPPPPPSCWNDDEPVLSGVGESATVTRLGDWSLPDGLKARTEDRNPDADADWAPLSVPIRATKDDSEHDLRYYPKEHMWVQTGRGGFVTKKQELTKLKKSGLLQRQQQQQAAREAEEERRKAVRETEARVQKVVGKKEALQNGRKRQRKTEAMLETGGRDSKSRTGVDRQNLGWDFVLEEQRSTGTSNWDKETRAGGDDAPLNVLRTSSTETESIVNDTANIDSVAAALPPPNVQAAHDRPVGGGHEAYKNKQARAREKIVKEAAIAEVRARL